MRFAIGRRIRWWQSFGGAAIGGPIYDKLSRRLKRLVLDFKPREFYDEARTEDEVRLSLSSLFVGIVSTVGPFNSRAEAVKIFAARQPGLRRVSYEVVESVPHILSKKRI